MTETQMDVIKWLAKGSTGVSSEAMAFWLGFVVKPKDCGHPHDPDDLDRCLRLLAAAPGLRADLLSMRGLSASWAALVERWSEIEASHLAEVGLGWKKAKSAPKTYELMRSILDPVRDASIVNLGNGVSVRFPDLGAGQHE